ncbi:MAG: type III-A CRISPR-associated protein Cas10/Csm1 [Methanobrevibacter sp.]|jgi:CRISPR-associated protein Csm1|nr:type III-A CRISPR-associated protein Cas10/Csm1 [Candidatus Methanovirga meridionalis]
MELEKIQIAALFHDIGKFHQRIGKKVKHSSLSADFVKEIWEDDVADLVLYHHEPAELKNSPKYKEMAQIIQKADHHSANERIEDDKNHNVNATPLISIFSKVKLENNKEIKEYYLPLEKLNLNISGEDSFESLRPRLSDKVSLDYKTLWKEFTDEFKKLNSPDFNTSLALLKKYTSTMPSAAYVSKPDISLFDHCKTTAALATCRYIFNANGSEKLNQTNHQKVYLAINGDISGIQNFIYKVSSPQDAQSGMSKRLRGRSLYINLLNDAIASKIIEELGLCQANILFCGGGRFIIIGANTEETLLKLENIKKEINDLFIDKFNAELYLSMSHEECSGDDLEGFGNITHKLNTKLSEDKNHKFINSLAQIFKVENEVKYENKCSVCGIPTDNDDGLCSFCRKHERLGGSATNSNYMIKVYSENYNKKFDFYEEVLKIGYIFEKDTGSLSNYFDDSYIDYERIEIIKLNDSDFLELDNSYLNSNENINFSFSFLGNTVPKDPKTTLYFEHLAKISRGAKKLGILKMDVDNLGKIFTNGFKHIEKEEVNEKGEKIRVKGATISRVSTLSSSLDIFFSGFINNVANEFKVFRDICPNCEDKVEAVELNLDENSETTDTTNDLITVYREKYGKVCDDCKDNAIPTIHINYSGGDDLLVFGPYDHIMEFAMKFREKFKQWTCENPSINLSAGINIIDSKFPIGKATITANDYLESAKECGKDKITVFNDVVSWKDCGSYKGYNELLDFGEELEKYVLDENISRGILYSMLRLWQDTFSDSTELINDKEKWIEDSQSRIRKKEYVPKFKYKLRNINNKSIRDDFDKKGMKTMPWIKIPVSWASLRTR